MNIERNDTMKIQTDNILPGNDAQPTLEIPPVWTIQDWINESERLSAELTKQAKVNARLLAALKRIYNNASARCHNCRDDSESSVYAQIASEALAALARALGHVS